MRHPLALAFLIALLVIAALFLANPRAFSPNALRQFSSEESLLQFLNETRESQQSYFGRGYWGGIGTTTGRIRETLTQTASSSGPRSDTTANKNVDFSPTNVQVQGVDEPDIVKTDGTWVYARAGDAIAIFRAVPLERVATLPLAGSFRDLFLDGDRLVAFTAQTLPYSLQENASFTRNATYPAQRAITRILIFSVADPTQPALLRNFTIDGSYTDSRLIDGFVYLLTDHGLTDPVVLPLYTEGPRTRPVAGYSDIFYTTAPDTDYLLTAVASFRTRGDAEPSAKLFLRGSVQTLSVSTRNIYLATRKQPRLRDLEREIAAVWAAALRDELQSQPPANATADILNNLSAVRQRAAAFSGLATAEDAQELAALTADYARLRPDRQGNFSTDLQERLRDLADRLVDQYDAVIIHRVAIGNGAISPAATGEVPGRLWNQFSLDEHNGYLRVATTARRETDRWGTSLLPAPRGNWTNYLHILNPDLTVAGRLVDLAPGENIYATRFLGDRAYLVTFVRIDPLFVIDVSDPHNPRVLGELKIPGYSDYLHPLDDTHLIGLGWDTADAGSFSVTQGIKVALFDVSNFTAPRLVANHSFGDRGTTSEALEDHHAFLFSRGKQLLAFPITVAELPPELRGRPDRWISGKSTWTGLVVFTVTPDSLMLRGNITHETPEEFKAEPPRATVIRRALYIGDTLYTLSEGTLESAGLADLAEQARLPL